MTSPLNRCLLAAHRMQALDWTFVAAFFVMTLLIGLWSSRRAGRSSGEFFLSGRTMPWWLLGLSMVATTFAADTPNLVTDIVRQNGVAGNWVWWAFLLTGMVTVFIYARLWRRTGVMTDVEFYELRYSGRPAAFLRGFRALYLGIFFNVIIMASVSLAAIKIGNVMLGFNPYQTLLIAAVVTATFSTLGGFRGVILTDCLLFFIAMVGSIAAAYFSVSHPDVGGLASLLRHENVADKLSLIPDFSLSPSQNPELLIGVFLLPLTVQWWAAWYPGSEPGGGGYIAQRMLAAKSEQHAVGATFFFNVAHYALRPWPWIIVALASLVIYPDIASLQTDFAGGGLPADQIKNDLAYPAMLRLLPVGWLGLVMTSLIAAYVSTISTHLNWGSSYIVNDFYQRFIKPDASQRELVWVGRASTIVLMVLSAGLALTMTNAKDSFDILLGVGAGTGLVYLLRWFWWRVNAWSEISAMVAAFAAFLYFRFFHGLCFDFEIANYWQFVWITLFTTVTWILTTLLTPPDDEETLQSFYKAARPGGPGWRAVVERAAANGQSIDDGRGWSVPHGLLCAMFGCLAVYCMLFGIGYALSGHTLVAVILLAVAATAMGFVATIWRKLLAR
jgi:solute:Na+ symporter, SSS family